MILKCKICGGDIDVTEDKSFGTCLYCGCAMTFPKLDDEQRAAMFNRGNQYRRMGEFDRAVSVYEQILREDDTDAEAHWCCALSKFGIEYVEDPNTYEWIPTCHRLSFDSFFDDSDYLAALEYSDGIEKKQYVKDASKIVEVQKGILNTSQNEEPFDVFICYKESSDSGARTADSVLAQDIYYQLTEKGYRVFYSKITLEDKAGSEFEPYIFAALNSAKVMVVVGTRKEYLEAAWVKNEWSRYLAIMRKNRDRVILPCYKDMDPYDMPEALSVLQSYDMSKIGFMQDLIRGIAKVLDASKTILSPESLKETVVVRNEGSVNLTALIKRGNMALEDGEFERADDFFEQVLNMDAECAEAYAGKLCAKWRYHSLSDIKQADNPEVLRQDKNYQKAIRYGREALQTEIEGYVVEAERIQREKIIEAERRLQARVEVLSPIRKRLEPVSVLISAGAGLIVGLRTDGTVVAADIDGYGGRSNVGSWTNIVAVAAGNSHTVGLRSDGTVVAVGRNSYGDVSGWTDMTAVAAGTGFTVGLRSDGTVVAVGRNSDGQCDVSGWTDIVAVAAGHSHTVGLKSNGTVVAVGSDSYGRCNVSGWTDIVAVAAGDGHTVGLKSNGTVVAVGSDSYGRCNVSGWTDIVAVAAGGDYTVGLRADGVMTWVGDGFKELSSGKGSWGYIVAVAAGDGHIVGLKSDGTVVTKVYNIYDQCNVDDWKLFNSIDTLEEDRRKDTEAKRAKDEEEQQIITKLIAEKATLQTKLANLGLVFTGKLWREIKTRLAEIETELNCYKGNGG